MNTPVRRRVENHAGEACIERNSGALFGDMDLPLLAMREVFLCHLTWRREGKFSSRAISERLV